MMLRLLALVGIITGIFTVTSANALPPTLTLRSPFDRNLDGAVNMGDVLTMRSVYNTQAGDPGYDRLADIDGDADIDIVDIVQFRPVMLQPCAPLCGSWADVYMSGYADPLAGFDVRVCYPPGDQIVAVQPDLHMAALPGSNILPFGEDPPDADGELIAAYMDFGPYGAVEEVGDGVLLRLRTTGAATDLTIGIAKIAGLVGGITIDFGGCLP